MASQRTKFRPHAAALLFGAMVLPWLATAAGAEDIYVKKAEVSIRNGKAAFNKVVATARAGDRLTVIERAAGGWYQVEAPGGVRGWVHEQALSRQPVEYAKARGPFGAADARQGGGGNVGRGAFDGNFASPDGSVSIAGHGWEAAAFGTAKKLDAGGLRRIKEARARAAEKAASFIAEGKLGSGK